MSNKILVLGSTGKTGKRVYSGLKAKNADVIPASRSGNVPFDWNNSHSWAKALSGIDTVYMTFQPDLAVPQSLPIITAFVAAAKEAGVGKLVLLSGRGEPEAMACENELISSGLQYTILRCSFFMQNFSEGFWADGIAAGEFVIPFVKSKEPFLDADDIAEVAVSALLNNEYDNKIYELTGPELLSFQDVIQKIAGKTDRDISFVQIPMDEYVSALQNLQIPDDYIWLIKYLFSEVLDGRNESVTSDVESVLGRKATSFDGFIDKTVKANAWMLSV